MSVPSIVLVVENADFLKFISITPIVICPLFTSNIHTKHVYVPSLESVSCIFLWYIYMYIWIIDEFAEDGAQLIRSQNKANAHTQKARGPINLLRTMPKASVTLCLRWNASLITAIAFGCHLLRTRLSIPMHKTFTFYQVWKESKSPESKSACYCPSGSSCGVPLWRIILPTLTTTVDNTEQWGLLLLGLPFLSHLGFKTGDFRKGSIPCCM
jgi:hypothetical protein